MPLTASEKRAWDAILAKDAIDTEVNRKGLEQWQISHDSAPVQKAVQPVTEQKPSVTSSLPLNAPAMSSEYGLPDVSVPIQRNKIDDVIDQRKAREEQGFLKNTIESFKRGQEGADLDTDAFDAAMGFKDWGEVKKRRDAYNKKLEEQPIKSGNLASKTIYDTAAMVGPMIKGSMEGGIAGMAAIVGGQMGPQVLTPEEVITAPTAFALGSGQYWYRQGAGSFYATLRESGVAHDKASAIAQGMGAPYALLEGLQIDKIVPGVKDLIKRRTNDIARQVIQKAIAKYGIEVTENTGQEVLQELTAIAAEEGGKAVSNILDGTDLKSAPINEDAKRLWDTGKQSILPMALLLAPNAAVGTRQQLNANKNGETGKATTGATNKTAEARPADEVMAQAFEDSQKPIETSPVTIQKTGKATGKKTKTALPKPGDETEAVPPVTPETPQETLLTDKEFDDIDEQLSRIQAEYDAEQAAKNKPEIKPVEEVKGQGASVESPVEEKPITNELESIFDKALEEEKTKPENATDKENLTVEEAKADGEEVTPTETTPKEPWEMTRDEYTREDADNVREYAASVPKGQREPEESRQYGYEVRHKLDNKLKMHKIEIKKAIAEGKEIPKEVLKDYPALAMQQTLRDRGIVKKENSSISEPPMEEKLPVKAKESWEMTKKEYLNADYIFINGKKAELRDKISPSGHKTKAFEISGDEWYSREEGDHKYLIRQAISRGDKVPESVLAEYPDLRPTNKENLSVQTTTISPKPGAKMVWNKKTYVLSPDKTEWKARGGSSLKYDQATYENYVLEQSKKKTRAVNPNRKQGVSASRIAKYPMLNIIAEKGGEKIKDTSGNTRDFGEIKSLFDGMYIIGKKGFKDQIANEDAIVEAANQWMMDNNGHVEIETSPDGTTKQNVFFKTFDDVQKFAQEEMSALHANEPVNYSPEKQAEHERMKLEKAYRDMEIEDGLLQMERDYSNKTDTEIPEGTLRQVKPDDNREDSQGAIAIAKAFGHEEPIFVESKDPAIIPVNGATLRERIYLNNDSDNHHIAVLGHEITHKLETEHPNLYKQITDVILEDRPAFEKWRKDNGKDGQDLFEAGAEEAIEDDFREFVSDTVGERMSDPAFWDRMLEKAPEAVKKIHKYIKDLLFKLSMQFNKNYKTSQYFRDIKRIRESIDNAMAEYAKRGGNLNSSSGKGKFQIKRSENAEPIIIKDSELTSITDIKKLRKAAAEYYDKNLLGTKVIHPKLGEIEFRKRSLRKAISSSANEKKLLVFPQLPEIISKAKLKLTEENRNPKETNIKTYYRIESPIKLNNENGIVNVLIKEDDKGKLYYNHGLGSVIIKEKTPSAQSGASLKEHALSGNSSGRDEVSSKDSGLVSDIGGSNSLTRETVQNLDTNINENPDSVKPKEKPKFQIKREAERKQDKWYSQMETVLDEKLPNRGTGKSYRELITAFANKGEYKAEELEWSGILEAENSPLNKDSVSKAEVIDWLDKNNVRVEEVTPDTPKFDSYVEPGGENYRELLITLPAKEKHYTVVKHPDGGLYAAIDQNGEYFPFKEGSGTIARFGDIQEANEYIEKRKKTIGTFKSSHFDTPNILAHVRFNERTDADGKKVLFVEEIQSDWHQAGKKKGYAIEPKFPDELDIVKGKYGYEIVYKNNGKPVVGSDIYESKEHALKEWRRWPSTQGKEGVPDAPFKKSWPVLAFKRVIRHAAENGFDKIAWTTGEQQAARYDLSKHLDSVDVREIEGTDKVTVYASKDNQNVITHVTSRENLADVIGKELAVKVIDDLDNGNKTIYSGLDLKVGGEGMKGFYDQILPAEVNKYVKKWGVKVGETKIITSKSQIFESDKGKQETVHSIDITPAMRKSAMGGQSKFQIKKNSPHPSNAMFDGKDAKTGEPIKAGDKVWIYPDSPGKMISDKTYRALNQKIEQGGLFDAPVSKPVEGKKLFSIPPKAEKPPFAISDEPLRGPKEVQLNMMDGLDGQMTLFNTKKQRDKVIDKQIENFKTTSGIGLFFTPISTELERINPKFKYDKFNGLRSVEHAINIKIKKYTEAVLPLIESFKKMSVDDSYNFDLAMKNGQEKTIKKFIDKYNLSNEHAQARIMLDELYNEGESVGLKIGYKQNYWPRMINDVTGFLNFLEGVNEWGVISEKIKEIEANIKRKLDDNEKANVANNMLRGIGNIVTLSKPGNLKERKIETVTDELNSFYYDTPTSLVKYIDKVVKNIEARRYFGKGEEYNEADHPDIFDVANSDDLKLNESIGKFTNKMKDDYKLTGAQENMLQGILTARFNYRATTGLAAIMKNLGYMSAMGSGFSSVITQIGDLANSIYSGGWVNTGLAFADAVQGKTMVSTKDLGIERIAEEFKDPTMLAKAVKKAFDVTGLSSFDSVFKNTLINSNLRRIQKEARKGQLSEGTKYILKSIFGVDAPRVLREIKEGNINDDARVLSFNILADFQPTTLSEMPREYLLNPRGRLLYQMKTYTIKQFDVIRRNAVWDLQSKDWNIKRRGARKLVYMAALMLLCNAAADRIKDFIFGRPFSLTQFGWDQFWKLFGVSRYVAWTFRTQGLESAIVKAVAPPSNYVEYPIADLNKALKLLSKGKIEEYEIKNMRTWQMAPVVGQEYYWWFGEGRDKSDKNIIKYAPLDEKADLYDKMVDKYAKAGRITAQKARKMKYNYHRKIRKEQIKAAREGK